MRQVNLIKERDERDEIRKIHKKAIDNAINLSAKTDKGNAIQLSVSGDNKVVRLLDEGGVVDAYGRPLFYIRKGVLKTFYDELSPDYVGSINLGHSDFATYPILLGEWSKQDLTLVDLGDGWHALDVQLKLNEDLSVVQDLRKQKHTLGVSAEFPYAVDEEATREFGIEILKAVDIRDFAIVGDAGNVNSGGINLKGGKEEMSKLTDRIAEYFGNKELAVDEAIEEVVETAEVAEEAKELDADTAEEVEEVTEDSEEEEAVEAILSAMSDMQEEIKALKANIGAKDEQIASLEAEKTARKLSVDGLLKKFKTAAAEIEKPEEKKEVSVTKVSADGWEAE